MEFTEGVRFDSLHLSPEIIRAIEKRNIEVSTPVQAGCIPPMMATDCAVNKFSPLTRTSFYKAEVFGRKYNGAKPFNQCGG